MATRTGLPQRRHGRPDRACTNAVSPHRSLPVVVWIACRRPRSSSRWARWTRADVASSSRSAAGSTGGAVRGTGSPRHTACRRPRGCAGRAGPRRRCAGWPAPVGRPPRGPSRGRARRVRDAPRGSPRRRSPPRAGRRAGRPRAVHASVPTTARSCRLASGAPRDRARGLDPPLALHPQVRVDGHAVVEPVQDVLPSRDDLEGRGPPEVKGRQLRPPQVARRQRRPGEGLVEPGRGAEDGVALRHGGRSACGSPATRGVGGPASSAQPQPARRGVEPGLGQGLGHRVSRPEEPGAVGTSRR